MLKFHQFLEGKNLSKIANKAGLDISDCDPNELRMGINIEKEHSGEMGRDVAVVDSEIERLKIAIAHLREDPKYYTKLKKIEEK